MSEMKVVWQCSEESSDGAYCNSPCRLEVRESDGIPCGCTYGLLDSVMWKRESDQPQTI